MTHAKRFAIIIVLVAVVASLGLIGGAAVGRADDEAQPQEAVPLGAGAPLLISYQGRLEDPATGNPKPNGDYLMTFRIYIVPSGGSPLWTEYQTVPLTNGLFNVHLGSVEPLTAALFNGTLRYLQVEVGGIVLSPRQRLTAVPYAIQATEAMTASYATNADTVDGKHATDFVNVSGDNMTGPLTVTGNTTSYVVSATNNNTTMGGGVYGSGDSYGVYGSGVHGVRGDGSGYGVYGIGGEYGVYGSGVHGVRGDGDTYGVYGSGGSTGYGGSFYNWATITPALKVRNDGGGNLIEGWSSVSDVEFKVTAAGNVEADGQFISGAATGTPPLVVTSTTQVNNLNADLLDGHHATDFVMGSHNHDATYVNVSGDNMSGPLTVTGNTPTYVITATNNSWASYSGGVYGSGYGYGVYGRSSSGSSDAGVYGNGATYGVVGSGGNAGVIGVGGATGSGGYFYNYAASKPALYGRNTGGGDIIVAEGSAGDVKFKVTGDGHVYGDYAFQTPASDFAELMAVEGDASAYAPGDVLCVSQSSDNTIARCAEAGSTAVIGVYSTKPGFVGGSSLDGDSTKIPVAVVGIVPVKASAEAGAIRRGDLLTTASLAGYATRALPTEGPLPGTVLGKALSPLESDTGVISVMITLR